MEALRNIEDKWNLTTQEALILLGCGALALIGLGVVIFLKRSGRKITTDDPLQIHEIQRFHSEKSCRGRLVEAIIGRVLTGSLRWSRAKKWEERPSPLLAFEGGREGWHSHNSESPVWQRPILMGERCQLPRFSGVILYDERGQLLRETCHHQEHTAAVGRTTLEDLL
ncbi:hypothetical protein SAY87_003006 [Trapa incisa]|uniref:Uncharacterized protein n=1 Tax=Trapa incisa TaxID=236973 RepID=A0AAN7KJV3_9MYRT|nr:hypothetical protein SAY87_003006 [Trapa incisa]